MNPTETELSVMPSQASKAKSDAAANDLWLAIRTIIGLQNQAPPLVPVEGDRSLPLSFNQER
ncbi:MAG: hypothetical protein AAGE96_18405, partial [Cyanobacteria bacterium P01_G01_bin.19]